MDKYLGSKLDDNTVKDITDNLFLVRKNKRGAVTRTINKLKGLVLTKSESKFYLNKLEHLAKDLSNLHDELGGLMLTYKLWNEDEFETQSLRVEEYDDMIQEIIVNLKTDHINTNDTVNPKAGEPKFLLLKIELPKFTGMPETYHKFIVFRSCDREI